MTTPTKTTTSAQQGTYFTRIQLRDRGYGLQPHYTDHRRQVEVLGLRKMTVTGQRDTEVADVRYLDTGETCWLRLKHLETDDGGDARKPLLGRSYAEIKIAGKVLAHEILYSHIPELLGKLVCGDTLSASEMQEVLP